MKLGCHIMKNILLLVVFGFTTVFCQNYTDSIKFCIAKDDFGITTADQEGKDSNFIGTAHLRVDKTTKFNISFDSNSNWSKANSIQNSTHLNKGVFDERWEYFFSNRILNFESQLNNSENRSLFFSVRIYNDINHTVSHDFKEKQWHHLLLEKGSFFNCAGPTMDNCSNPIDVLNNNNTNFFIETASKKSFWKVHNYTYFYTDKKKEREKIYESSKNCYEVVEGCIQIYLASCQECLTTLIFESGNNTHTENFNGTGNWKTIKINLNEMTNISTCFNLSITSNTTEQNPNDSSTLFWAIGDIGYLSKSRKCEDNKRYLQLKQSDIEANNLTCENANNTKIDFVSEEVFRNLTQPLHIMKYVSNISGTEELEPSVTKKASLYYLFSIIPIVLLIIMFVFGFLYIRKVKLERRILTNEEKELLDMKKQGETEMCCDWTPIKTEVFADYVRNSFGENRTHNDIEKQFKCLSMEYLKDAEVGKLPGNVEKNRYPNICPYDENRVKLEKSLTDQDSTDYINASYVTGYNSDKEYILTQNPLEHTVQDFCKMIWQEGVEYIVMITNLNEKFFCYWPNKNKTKRFGDIEIDTDDVTSYEFYTHRQLTIRRFGQYRNLTHLHFNSWPQDVLSSHIFLQFINHLLEIPHILAPIVFHCLAGIGRSATIVLCDIALRTSSIKNVLPLYDIVTQMRQCRAGTVPNLRQYQLAHLIIFDFLTYKNCSIEINHDFEAYFSRLVEGNTTKTMWSQYLENSDWMYEAITPYKVCKKYRKRNRYPDDKLLPVEHSRVALQYKEPDYIHAMFVNNYKQHKSYIVAQQPLASTLSDFWVMILQNHVKTIINVHELDAQHRGDVQFYPTLENDVIKTQGQSIHFKSLDNHLLFEKVHLQVYSMDKLHSNISLYNIRNWHKIKAIPESTDVIINIWESICGGKDGKVQNFPLLVCCDDGVVSSSLVVCFFYLVEKMLEEHKCDIVAAVRALRRSHINFINFEQFVFLHHCALMYYKNYFHKYCKKTLTL